MCDVMDDFGATSMSNPTERVVAVIDFLTANPFDAFTLSELARRLQMSKSTCRAVLSTLARAGYVGLDASGGYSLGPAVVAVGNAFAARLPVLPAAHDAMHRLFDATSVGCAALARSSDQIIIVGRVGLVDPLAQVARFGHRTPLIAPLGSALVAWADPSVYRGWLGRGLDAARRVGLDDDHVVLLGARYESLIETVRERGFSVSLETPADLELQASLRADVLRRRGNSDAQPAMGRYAEALATQEFGLDHIEVRRSYDVRSIVAPVFDRDGGASMALSLEGFRWNLRGSEITELAHQLLTEVERLGATIGVRTPRYRGAHNS